MKDLTKWPQWRAELVLIAKMTLKPSMVQKVQWRKFRSEYFDEGFTPAEAILSHFYWISI